MRWFESAEVISCENKVIKSLINERYVVAFILFSSIKQACEPCVILLVNLFPDNSQKVVSILVEFLLPSIGNLITCVLSFIIS